MRLNFPLSRLTTGTPPRLDGKTVDYSRLEPQYSDEVSVPMSYMNFGKPLRNEDNLVKCHLTFTNQNTHDVVSKHFHRLPKFVGNEGKGQGPR